MVSLKQHKICNVLEQLAKCKSWRRFLLQLFAHCSQVLPYKRPIPLRLFGMDVPERHQKMLQIESAQAIVVQNGRDLMMVSGSANPCQNVEQSPKLLKRDSWLQVPNYLTPVRAEALTQRLSTNWIGTSYGSNDGFLGGSAPAKK